MTVYSTIMTSFNVTDTNVTIIFDVQASDNASVLLLLAMGSPPNATNASSSTILNHTGSRSSTSGGGRIMRG